MDDDRRLLVATFLAEAEENLAAIEQSLLALETQPQDGELLARIFRAAHTLKGNAAAFGLEPVVELAHLVEDVLARLRSGTLALDTRLVNLLLGGVDELRQRLAGDGEAAAGPESPLLVALRSLRAAGSPRQGARRGRGRPASGQSPALGDPPAPAAAAQRTQPAAGSALAPGTLRVRIEKLDRLLNLSGELAVARGRLQLLLESAQSLADLRRVRDAHHEADRLHAELQELVMDVRMVAVGPAFRGFGRLVRDQAAAEGKQARLALAGEQVEVDTRILDEMRDPLTHLVRNALGHGIESCDERRARGKDPCGTIALSARHEGGHVVFEVADDGAGLDRRRILERARERGLIATEERLTERQIDALVLEPGFSTASAVTNLVGRGVGLDVVRRHIERLRGTLTIDSREGEGTRFVARVPLTLAIISGFAVGVDGETYLVPLESVVETLALDGAPAATDPSSGHRVVQLRGEPLPCARLRAVLELGGAPPRREQVLVVQHEGRRSGLIVDALHGESQTVIKPLASLLRRLPGISGSAILGTGRVALILDVAALVAGIEDGARSRFGGGTAVPDVGAVA